MNKIIAVVDDEPDILKLVSHHLRKAGFTVKELADGASFFKFVNERIPDLVILDLMLPDADGLEICKHLKSKEELSFIPIIMLTAKGEETDKIVGLELGADDYVTKPFSPKELVARVKAVLRRRKETGKTKKIDVEGRIIIDIEKYEVLVDGDRIELTPTEFKILKLLASNRGRVYARAQILDYLWGDEKYVTDRTVDVHVNHLREKIGKASGFIKNVRGVGYKIEE